MDEHHGKIPPTSHTLYSYPSQQTHASPTDILPFQFFRTSSRKFDRKTINAVKFQTAQLQIDDENLNAIARNWTEYEKLKLRRIVKCQVNRRKNDIYATFSPTSHGDSVPDTVLISCIWSGCGDNCYITRDDIEGLLKTFIGQELGKNDKEFVRHKLFNFGSEELGHDVIQNLKMLPSPSLFASGPGRKSRKVLLWLQLAKFLKSTISRYSAILPESSSNSVPPRISNSITVQKPVNLSVAFTSSSDTVESGEYRSIELHPDVKGRHGWLTPCPISSPGSGSRSITNVTDPRPVTTRDLPQRVSGKLHQNGCTDYYSQLLSFPIHPQPTRQGIAPYSKASNSSSSPILGYTAQAAAKPPATPAVYRSEHQWEQNYLHKSQGDILAPTLAHP